MKTKGQMLNITILFVCIFFFLARIKRTDLGKAKTIVGTCPDMCPEKERYMRETRNQLSIFELLLGSDKVWALCKLEFAVPSSFVPYIKLFLLFSWLQWLILVVNSVDCFLSLSFYCDCKTNVRQLLFNCYSNLFCFVPERLLDL